MSKPDSSKAVGVFCGAAAGQDPKWLACAAELGAGLAAAGHSLIYGGGNTGLMGALAQAALAAGGEVIGVMPELLIARERALTSVTRLETVPDMATRKQRLIALSDVFVSLPGGLGTLDELFEVLTWYQLDLHAKPSWILNLDDFYTPLLAQIARMQQAGFLHSPRLPLQAVADVGALLAGLAAGP